ncbi:MAG: class II histone deacetylase, partial [Granulosicoccaceae bacterium]
MSTAYLFDERCLWHNPGQFALVAPVGGFVQPGAEHPDNPETKRRLHNLVQVSGLHQQLDKPQLIEVNDDDLLRIHSAAYLARLEQLSVSGGGDAGECAPFGVGGYDQARVAASLVKTAVFSVLQGDNRNAYALSRPAGHHAERDRGRGFCLLANIPLAIEAARASFGIERVAIVDWDVHHGNGQESLYYQDPSTLTISLHQELIYPEGRGLAEHRGLGAGAGSAVNIQMLAGSGGGAYHDAFERIVIPELERFSPELVVLACGFD